MCHRRRPPGRTAVHLLMESVYFSDGHHFVHAHCWCSHCVNVAMLLLQAAELHRTACFTAIWDLFVGRYDASIRCTLSIHAARKLPSSLMRTHVPSSWLWPYPPVVGVFACQKALAGLIPKLVFPGFTKSESCGSIWRRRLSKNNHFCCELLKAARPFQRRFCTVVLYLNNSARAWRSARPVCWRAWWKLPGLLQKKYMWLLGSS